MLRQDQRMKNRISETNAQESYAKMSSRPT